MPSRAALFSKTFSRALHITDDRSTDAAGIIQFPIQLPGCLLFLNMAFRAHKQAALVLHEQVAALP